MPDSARRPGPFVDGHGSICRRGEPSIPSPLGAWGPRKGVPTGERSDSTANCGSQDTLRIEVAAWRDQTEAPVARAHTVTGTVRHHDAFPSKFVRPRDVLVWLPPGYARDPKQRYPVVYFHDGQNVFDAATSFIGAEWGADEAADRLIGSGKIPPVIMVAVSNTAARMDEYTSTRDERSGGGNSGAYFRFLVEELQPFMNRTYRTRTTPRHTAVIGSSLGGLAALNLGLSYPEAVRPDRVCVAGGVVGRECDREAGSCRREAQPLRVCSTSAMPRARRRRMAIARAPITPATLRDALLESGWREREDLHYEEIEEAPQQRARMGRAHRPHSRFRSAREALAGLTPVARFHDAREAGVISAR